MPSIESCQHQEIWQFLAVFNLVLAVHWCKYGSEGASTMDTCFNLGKLLIQIYRGIFPQGFQVSGIENLPAGAKIIAANHPNATDAIHLPFILKEHFYILMQGDLFSIPVLGWLFAGSGQIPIYRNQGGVAIHRACELLAQGKTVLIFPEGRLNPEIQLLKGGSGTVRMSLMSEAPIVPLGIYIPKRFTRNVVIHDKGLLRQGRWQTGGQCYFQFGLPWRPTQQVMGKYKVPPVRELTHQLMQQIYTLARRAQLESLDDDCLETVETPLDAEWDYDLLPPVSTRSATRDGLTPLITTNSTTLEGGKVG
jgi:1-acyl-sn-glycerol-3-phosphate acyltransferase